MTLGDLLVIGIPFLIGYFAGIHYGRENYGKRDWNKFLDKYF